MAAILDLVLLLVLLPTSYSRTYIEQEWRKGRTASLHPEIIWQGFHFQWLRRELGFETPHRLGSFASYIYNVSSACNTPGSDRSCSVLGTYQVQFTPGVSGDYAYPKVYYQTAAATNSAEIDLATGSKTFSFQDKSASKPVLHADTSLSMNITLALSNPQHSLYQLLLQGFHVEMRCIATADHFCNSNAVWPYYFNISLAQNCTVLPEQKVAVCPLHFALGRGWTPSDGGGKAYNYQMAYNVTVYYMRISYSLNGGSTMLKQRITQKGTIYQSPLSGQQQLPNTSAAKQSALLGITEFSWDLTQTDGHQDRGRYLEELAFFISQSQEKMNESEEISYTWTMGYRDPVLTTYSSDVQYSLAIAAVISPKENLMVSVSSAANGSVCMDNEDIFKFSCSKLGLKSTTQDTVNIHGTLN